MFSGDDGVLIGLGLGLLLFAVFWLAMWIAWKRR